MFDLFVPEAKIVTCRKCKRIHHVDSETFVTIAGNIMVGLEGGLVGNAFDEEGKLKYLHILCRTPECAGKMLEYLRPYFLGE